MLTIHDRGFLRFGRVIDIDSEEIVNYLSKIKAPETGNSYIASDPEFEKLTTVKALKEQYFGSLDMQAGYCNGNNQFLNCEEYHGCIEINVAADDCTLFLGTLDDIKDEKLDSSVLEEVFVKKGEAFFIYPGTLHFSPCVVHGTPFHMAVLLAKGTNLPLESKDSDSKLFKKNKWLIAHKDAVQASNGAYVGIIGENRRASLAK